MTRGSDAGVLADCSVKRQLDFFSLTSEGTVYQAKKLTKHRHGTIKYSQISHFTLCGAILRPVHARRV